MCIRDRIKQEYKSISYCGNQCADFEYSLAYAVDTQRISTFIAGFVLVLIALVVILNHVVKSAMYSQP